MWCHQRSRGRAVGARRGWIPGRGDGLQAMKLALQPLAHAVDPHGRSAGRAAQHDAELRRVQPLPGDQLQHLEIRGESALAALTSVITSTT